ncbi:MAG: tRNA uridine-5-carboxymethylaminomethyl(34) synthesis enzyme MnmG [Spirochaetes bacterium]|nr:tRNA uridine-5-carboxymethylaminomethyl(34) synthesis enzyme MnmG [Spirochaetota bacterium]
MQKFDIIVIGAGHAGIEASMAGARMGLDTALITMDASAVGRMSCNPAIGGTAKGHLVHEIDALGGVMGKIADRTGIQFRVLNKSKGPAVWSSRCQSDMDLYSTAASRIVKKQDNLTVIEGIVEEIIEENKKVRAVKTKEGETLYCKAAIICSGTFLNGLMYTGLDSTVGGRYAEESAEGLSLSLKKLGFKLGRLKTGTPPRIKSDSIDFKLTEIQHGDELPKPFSFHTDQTIFPYLNQLPCHITYTSEQTHKFLEEGFDRSPLFTGIIKGVGPRYCPSIEDKIVRFSDKPRHQLFLEPQGLNSDLIYVNGFPTSLPEEIQLKALHSIKGLEKAEIVRYGYAVEYDFVPTYNIFPTLESKTIEGFYLAGQINGTSGYEEAAAQGLMAGINAVLKIRKEPEFILKRSQAYIGVLLDDLVNKIPDEPYRMFTSRAEYRLLLRQDNADRRLMDYGYKFGLIDEQMYKEFKETTKLIEDGVKTLRKTRIHANAVNPYLEKKDSSPIDSSEIISIICRRSGIRLKDLIELANRDELLSELLESERALNNAEIELKYEGYIKRQQDLVDKFEKHENKIIPRTLDYTGIKALSKESIEKMAKIKPRSIGQASRIAGVSPADISVLMIYLRAYSG